MLLFLSASAAYVFGILELSLVFGLLLLIPFALTNSLTELMARIAETHSIEPNTWFAADVQREKRRHGPLRAKRKFGHPVGKSK